MEQYTILDWLQIVSAPVATREPITDPARLLSAEHPYHKAVRLAGSRPTTAWLDCEACRGESRWQPSRFHCTRCHGTGGKYVTAMNLPHGGSWLQVKGRPESNLLAKRQREYRRWLKDVEKACRENPSTTFQYRPKGPPPPSYVEQRWHGKVRSIDDAMVQLQLLGVTL